jgi:FkbM family methyltransferase
MKQLLKKSLVRLLGPVRFNLIRERVLESRQTALAAKREALYAHFLGKGDLFFDVGANMGNRIQAALACGAKVVAVEPQPLCQAILTRRFGASITRVPKAAGAQAGRLPMHVSDAHTVSSMATDWISKVKGSGRFRSVNWNKTIDVEVTTLDALIEEFGKPSFLKIDVEGYEWQVLQGLKRNDVAAISFEYTVPEFTDGLLECLTYIHQLNPQYLFNYSISETAELANDEWLSYDAMRSLVSSDSFTKTDFGDIYARLSR